MAPRVVVTGIGVLSPIGLGFDPYWQSVKAGRSGVRRMQHLDPAGFPTQVAGEIPHFDAKEFLDKKRDKQTIKGLKMMARPIQLAVAATNLALVHGKLDPAKLDPTRFGVDYGAGLIASELEELGPAAQLCTQNDRPAQVDMQKWGEAGIPIMGPLWMLKYLPNMFACHVSIMHNAQGPSNTITQADAAPLLALGEAYRILQRDQADVMLTGGADSRVNPLSLSRLCLFAPLTRRNDEPERASRPFDKDRDGFVPGEGSGVFILESLDHARRRGARIYAEVAGFAAAFDRRRDGAGLARAIRGALEEAGIGPEQVDHVNAHGYGTIREDAWEAQGIFQVFGGVRPVPPVFAGKSFMGNLGAGAALVELAASLASFQEGVLPGSLNYDHPDPECPVNVHTGAARAVVKHYVVKISLTDRGQCAVAVLRRWQE